MKTAEKTLELIKDLILQCDVYASRCRTYIVDTDWSLNSNENADLGRQEEGRFQKDMTKSLDKTILFLDKHKAYVSRYEEDLQNGYKFEENIALQRELHKPYESMLKKLKNNIRNIDWTEIEVDDDRYEEGRFQAKMIDQVGEMMLNLERSIGIEIEEKGLGKLRGGKDLNPFTDILINTDLKSINQPANLAYRDWFINQKVPDKRNPQEYNKFWLKHLSYCKTGLWCGGVYFSGWLYYHINFFKLSVNMIDEVTGETETEIINPMFRDNEWYFEYYYLKAQKQFASFMAVGTRRFSKTALAASRISWRTLLFKDSNSLVAGLSSSDLNHIRDAYDVNFKNRPECFEDIQKIGAIGDTSPVMFLKIKLSANSKDIDFSSVTHVNLEPSKKGKSQKVSGGKYIEVFFDEVGKESYSTQFTSLLPALATLDGRLSCSSILAGTGGSVTQSKDCEGDFLNANVNGFYVCNPLEYAETVNGFEYRQISDKKIGFFVPCQMSMYAGKKKTINFSDYLKCEFTPDELDELEGFKIEVTDFATATETCKQLITSAYNKGEEEGNMTSMFLPFQPEDCFKYGESSKFDTALARQTQVMLQDMVKDGKIKYKHVWLTEDKINKKVIVNESNYKPYDKFPFAGGAWNAPVVICEEPISINPPFAAYVAGMDCYKQDITKSSPSLGTVYILKRFGGELKLVAWYVSRPQIQETFNNQAYLLLKLYNARCLAELEDLGSFKSFLDRKSATTIYLEKGLAIAKQQNPDTQTISELGFSRTPAKNIAYLDGCEMNYLCKPYDMNYDSDSQEEVVGRVGMEMITDPMLLEEYIQAEKYKNFDRRVAFQLALGLNEWFDTKFIIPKFKDENSVQHDNTPKRPPLTRMPSNFRRKVGVFSV